MLTENRLQIVNRYGTRHARNPINPVNISVAENNAKDKCHDNKHANQAVPKN